MIIHGLRPAPVRRLSSVLAALALLLAFLPAPAHAEGPGYGGNANALTLRWHRIAQNAGLAIYAFGFRAGVVVRIRVGSADECRVPADRNGEVRISITLQGRKVSVIRLVAETTGPDVVQAGAAVVVVGETPAGAQKTLIGTVPPAASGVGAAQLVPVALALMLAAVVAVRLRRRFVPPLAGRHRHRPRHRMA